MKKKENLEQFPLRLSTRQKSSLDILSYRLNRSKTDIIRGALDQYFAQATRYFNLDLPTDEETK